MPPVPALPPALPAFPRLFELIDATPDEVAGVSFDGFEGVNELCYHCKACYNHCPYTPPHEWDVDFPALMRRQQVARARARVSRSRESSSRAPTSSAGSPRTRPR